MTDQLLEELLEDWRTGMLTPNELLTRWVRAGLPLDLLITRLLELLQSQAQQIRGLLAQVKGGGTAM